MQKRSDICMKTNPQKQNVCQLQQPKKQQQQQQQQQLQEVKNSFVTKKHFS